MIKNTVVMDNKNLCFKNDFVFSLEGKDLRYTVQMTVFYWLVKTFLSFFIDQRYNVIRFHWTCSSMQGRETVETHY